MKSYRIINLKEGMPAVQDAMAHLGREIRMARRQQVGVIKLIHGFGASGKGGKIRLAVRRELAQLQKRGYVQYYILGEQFSIFDEQTRKAFSQCDMVRRDPDLERHNNGITLVVL